MKTVLLTDDNPDMIELVALILSKSGYELMTAAGGEEAIKICLESLPDLVLMDLKMPDIDGFTAIKSLREKGFKNPIVVLTSSESEEDKKRAFDVGCDRYLLKSLEITDLEPTIDYCLQKSGGI